VPISVPAERSTVLGKAVIASLADSLTPEADERGGPAVASSTASGFVLWYVLSLWSVRAAVGRGAFRLQEQGTT
jgi:hypothetical protein